MLLLTFLSPILKNEWDLTSQQSAGIVSAVFAGAMIGTLLLGSMGDIYGRRPVYLLSASCVAFFGFATCLATNYQTLVGIRFCVGFGVGGLVVPFDILAEFLPTSRRGKFLLYSEFFWTLGSLSVPIFAYITIGKGTSWVVFVFLCSIPCFIGTFMGVCMVPESPRWLVSQGRVEEALVILRKAAAINGKNADAVFPQGLGLKIEEHENSSYAELLKPKWRNITICLWGVWFGLSFCYYGTIMVVTRAFQDEGNEDEVVFDFGAIFISSTAEVVGTILVICTVDLLGRIASQCIFYSLGGIFVFLLCFFSNAALSALPTFFAFFARVFEMAATSCTWVTTAEMFGTEVRTTGHSSANAMARLAGIIAPFIIQSNIPLPIVGFILLCIHAITVAIVSQLPETKGKEMGSAGIEHDNRTIGGTELQEMPEIS